AGSPARNDVGVRPLHGRRRSRHRGGDRLDAQPVPRRAPVPAAADEGHDVPRPGRAGEAPRPAARDRSGNRQAHHASRRHRGAEDDAGGAGAAGTALDYARFSQMLANGGKLDGQRLLARTIVRHMTSDHLGDIKPAHQILAPGYGFGLGFAVRRADGLNGAPGSAGEFTWGGAGGTAFWIDPKEQLVAVLMTQAQPGPWQREFKELFRQLVYQAIAE